MSIENEIRKVLRHRAMTVGQLSYKLNASCSVIDRVTGYRMSDVYEDDDEKLKILGVKYKSFSLGLGGKK